MQSSIYLKQIGDVLFEVQGNNVYCMDPAKIGTLLLGSEGTQASTRNYLREDHS